jgi:hypothetical protein
MGSSFGTLFRIHSFGESHGGGVGVIVDGCPPRLELDLAAIQADLDRRKPGQSKITTPRKEDDQVEILSGLLDGVTLGTPIAMLVRNKDQRPQDYQEMAVAFRPSHADATYQAKYGIQARSGGGRASARETIGRVAAGAIARQLLARANGTEVIAWVRRIHDITNAQFRSKFDDDLGSMCGTKGIGVISDYEDQPVLVASHLGNYAIATVGVGCHAATHPVSGLDDGGQFQTQLRVGQGGAPLRVVLKRAIRPHMNANFRKWFSELVRS